MDNDIDWQLEKKSLNERFRELYKLTKWTDCTFSVGETKTELIKCHKLVLAASSPVFEALFYGSMADFNDKVIHIPDLDPKAFKLLVKYMYCDSVDITDIFSAAMLLYASKKYMIPHLSRICVDYLTEHLHIYNIYEMLEIIELLDEEELLNTCVKIMSKYSVNVWPSDFGHISKTVLCRLLDQDASNSTELELWNFVVSWVKTECKLNNKDPTPEAMRLVIDELGLLQRIRFLTFSNNELIDFVKRTCIISDKELEILSKCITSIETGSYCQCDNRSENCNCSDACDKCDIIVPKGFNGNSNKRVGIVTYSDLCPRIVFGKYKAWTYGGTVGTKISARNHTLVIGFVVFTRMPSSADFCMSRGKAEHYNERLVVRVRDESGLELSKTDYSGLAEFNATQSIKLAKPIWFHADQIYTVTFELQETGQYPLYNLSKCASYKFTRFHFEDFPSYPEVNFDVNIICTVMFSL